MSTQPLGPEALGAVAPQPTFDQFGGSPNLGEQGLSFAQRIQQIGDRGLSYFGRSKAARIVGAGGLAFSAAVVGLVEAAPSADASGSGSCVAVSGGGYRATTSDGVSIGTNRVHDGETINISVSAPGSSDNYTATAHNGYVQGPTLTLRVSGSGSATYTYSGRDYGDPHWAVHTLTSDTVSWTCPRPSKSPSPPSSSSQKPKPPKTSSAPAPRSSSAHHTTPASHPTTHVAAPQTSSEVVAPPPHHKPTHHASKSASKSKSAAASSSEASSISASSASLSQAASSVVVSPSASSSLESTPAAANVKNTGGNGPIAPWVLGGLAVVAVGGTVTAVRRRGGSRHHGRGLIAGK